MRRYLSNMDEVAHYWANQVQECGESHNIFFVGHTIYSYGRHFKVGVIVKNEAGEKAYVLNANSYSNSTAKHQSAAWRAIPGGSQIFHIPDCEVPCWNSKGVLSGYVSGVRGVLYYLLEIEKCIKRQSRARKYNYSGEISDYAYKMSEWIKFWGLDKRKKWAKNTYGSETAYYKSIDHLFTDNNALKYIKSKFCLNLSDEELTMAIEVYKLLRYFGLVGERPHDEGFSLTAAVNGVVERYLGSEVYEKIKAAREKEVKRIRLEEKHRVETAIKKDLEKLARWHRKEIDDWYPSLEFIYKYNWHTALRIKGDKIQTSKRITISIEEAKRLWRILNGFHNGVPFTHQLAVDLSGQSWKFNDYKNDVLTAGCHSIPYSEMESIAKHFNWI